MSVMNILPSQARQSSSPFHTLILDVGGVLFSWTAATKTPIHPTVLGSLLSSTTWHDFERGRISQDECYSALASSFSLDVQQITISFEEARKSLRSDDRLIKFIADLKQKYGLTVFAMSNISSPDYAYLRGRDALWDTFDDIFTSCAAGERKPDLAFYRHVLSHTNVSPVNTIFIDDKPVNVLSARSLGMCGVVFKDTDQLIQTIGNLICDPIERANSFLTTNARLHYSFTETSVIIAEHFSQFIIFELTRDQSIVEIPDSTNSTKLFNFFCGKGQLTSEDYPCDLDTTSIAWTTVKETENKDVHCVMDEMLKYCNSDGILQVYFDHSRPRLDPVVCVNVLALFYKHGRGADVTNTLEWVVAVLTNRAYLDGTRYYANAECFLYFFARLLTHNTELYEKHSSTLTERLRERIGSEGDSLALAMRIVGCKLVGIQNEIDLQRLLSRQALDGSWYDGWFYRYGVHKTLVANKGVTTALAIRAIRSARP